MAGNQAVYGAVEMDEETQAGFRSAAIVKSLVRVNGLQKVSNL
jgi:hypothetical protein